MGRAEKAKAILSIIPVFSILLARIAWMILKFKIVLWVTRRSYVRRFRRSLKGLPRDLREELSRDYDYKLKRVLRLGVKDFAELWRKR